MINTVWLFLISFGLITGMLNGKTGEISTVIFASAGKAIEFAIGLAGLIAFWSGILKIAEKAGLTGSIARVFQPLLALLFPSLSDKRHILGLISMTVAANLLGLGNVSTPVGLKTMEELRKLDPKSEAPSNAICTFITLILGGLTLVPSTLIAVRAQIGSAHPAVVIGPVTLITLVATVVGLLINYLCLHWKTTEGKARRRREQRKYR